MMPCAGIAADGARRGNRGPVVMSAPAVSETSPIRKTRRRTRRPSRSPRLMSAPATAVMSVALSISPPVMDPVAARSTSKALRSPKTRSPAVVRARLPGMVTLPTVRSATVVVRSIELAFKLPRVSDAPVASISPPAVMSPATRLPVARSVDVQTGHEVAKAHGSPGNGGDVGRTVDIAASHGGGRGQVDVERAKVAEDQVACGRQSEAARDGDVADREIGHGRRQVDRVGDEIAKGQRRAGRIDQSAGGDVAGGDIARRKERHVRDGIDCASADGPTGLQRYEIAGADEAGQDRSLVR